MNRWKTVAATAVLAPVLMAGPVAADELSKARSVCKAYFRVLSMCHKSAAKGEIVQDGTRQAQRTAGNFLPKEVAATHGADRFVALACEEGFEWYYQGVSGENLARSINREQNKCVRDYIRAEQIAVSKTYLKNAYTAAQAYFSDVPNGTVTESTLYKNGLKRNADIKMIIENGTSRQLCIEVHHVKAGGPYRVIANGDIGQFKCEGLPQR